MEVSTTKSVHPPAPGAEGIALLADLAPAIPGFIYIYDMLSEAVAYANRRVSEYLGYQQEDVESMAAYRSLVHPDDRALLDRHMTRLATAADGDVLEFDYRILASDGQWRWFHGRDTVYRRDPDGRVRLIAGTTQDMTNARATELALKESRARFQRLSNAAFEAIIVHDQGVILDGNQTLAQMFGYEFANMIGMDGFQLAAPECRDMLRSMVRKGFEEPYEAVGLRSDGTRFPMEIIGKQMPYETRTVRVVAVRDITERKRAEDELRAKAEAQRLLRNELDHRVRNNLSALLGLIDLAARTTTNTPSLLEAMRRRIETMATVHALLSRGEWKSLPIDKLIRAIVGGGHPGRVATDGEPVEVAATRLPALAMVLNELTINSLKHGALGQEGGTVQLTWSPVVDENGPRTVIEWIEQGGPRVEPPEHVGMGVELINGLMKTELNGRAQLEFPPDGARHRLLLEITA